MAGDYDKALYRLTNILSKLSNNERLNSKEFAKEFNVSERTIQKDIYQRLIDFPIQKDENGKFKFIGNYTLNKSLLDHKEIMLVSLAISQFEEITDLDKIKNSVFKKISSPGFFNPYYIKHEDLEDIKTDSSFINRIEDAIEYRNIINIKLEHKDLKIEPYKIANFDGLWYLFAKDLDDGKTKTFMLKNILKVKITDKKYKTSYESINKVLENVHSAWFDDGEAHTVVVKVKKEIAHYFKNKDYLQSQEIIKEEDDGSIEVSFEITHYEDIDNIIKSWIPHIEIISPIEYKENIKKELTKYVQNLS